MAPTSVTFTTKNAGNGSDITGTVPTSKITLAANHSYFFSYSVKVNMGTKDNTLSVGLIADAKGLISSITSTTSHSLESVAGTTIFTVGATATTLELQTQLSKTSTVSLINASDRKSVV